MEIEEEIERRRLSGSSLRHLLLGDRKEKDCRQNNNGTDPETHCHFVHITKEKEGHDDAVHRLEVSDERYPEGGKFAHYRHSGDVRKRSTDGAEQQKIADIGTAQDHRFIESAGHRKKDGDPNKGSG